MDILVNVSNQKLKLETNLHSLVEGSQKFVRFVFDLSSEWDGLLVFAQFTQNGNSYNQYLDDNNCVYLPAEIVAGECTVMLYGSGHTVIGTTNYLTLHINDSILVSDAESTDITESLYNQLVSMVLDMEEKIDKKQNTWFATCSSPAYASKEATTTTGDFVLAAGNSVRVHFSTSNYATNPTLNVDGTGAVDISSVHTGVPGAGALPTYTWGVGEVVDFVYDGTYFVIVDGLTATTSIYGATKLSTSYSSTDTNLAATPYAVKKAYDLADSKVSDVKVNGSSAVSGRVANVTVPTATSDLTNDSNFVSDADYVHTDNNYTDSDASKLNGISEGATATSVTQRLQSGTKIAEIDVDGVTTDIYAPSGGGGGGTQNIWYATCSTSYSTTAKVATTTSGDFVLATGNMVRVRFTDHSYDSYPTLNVDGTGATAIRTTAFTSPYNQLWTSGEVVDFVYDGTYFIMSDGGKASTSVYGVTKLSTSTSSTDTDLAATPSAVKSAYDLADSKVSDVEVNGTSVISEGIASVTVPTKTSDLTNDSGFITTDEDTTYSISETDGVITLTGSDSSTSTVNAVTDVEVDGVSVVTDGVASITTPSISAQNIWYGTCSYATTSQGKGVTTTTGDFVRATGNMVRVKFTNTNTAINPYLNVDGTGVGSIKIIGTTSLDGYEWQAGEVVDFVYDGSNYVMSDGGLASTSYYGVTKLSSSTSSTSTSLAATPSAVKAAYDLADSKVSDVEVNGTSVVSSGIADVTVPTKTSDLTNDSGFITTDEDTTYSLSENDGIITLDGSDGSSSDVITVTDVEVNGSSVVVDGIADITIPSAVTQNTWYATCSTGSSTSAKSAYTTTGDFALATGNMVRVKFSSAQSATSATLSVDGTTAKSIIYIGGGTSIQYMWRTDEVVDFVYDGTNFIMSDGGTATTTYYGVTKLSSSTSSSSTAYAATPSAVKAAYDLADSKVSDVEVNGTSVVSGGVASVTVPTATSDLMNDSDFVSDASYVHTDNNFTNADATKLSGIEAGAEVNVQSDWTQADSTADDYIKNKPTIPTVNNGTLTIQKNGNSVGTFTANQSGNSTANITVPTAVSDLTNDSGFTAVSYTQTLASGTKIGEIDVDGVTTDIYAPSGGGGGGSGVAAGTIVPFGGNVAALPDGWLFCDGSEVSRTTYADLFGAIGTAYGSGDGSTTFNLPDLRGRFAVGVNGSTLPNGANPNLSLYARGATGGSESVTLTTNEMPSHHHDVTYAEYNRGTGSSTASALQYTGSTKQTSDTGGGQAHENRPPYKAVNYIISTGTGVGTVVNDVEVNGTSVVSGGVADIDLTDYIKEDASGDISITGGADFGDDVNIDGAVNAENLPGIIKMFAGTFAPTGWLLCNGDEVAIEDYPFLYDVIGDTYGTPSDSDHFVLPDFRGRSPLGAGIGTASDATLRTLGQEGGSERVTLSANQSGLRAHTHGFTQPTVNGGSCTITSSGAHTNHTMIGYGATLGTGSTGWRFGSGGTKTATGIIEGGAHTHTVPGHTHTVTNGAVGAVTGGAVGASESHGNMSPYLTVNYIISTGGASRWSDSAGLPIVRDVTVNGQSVVNNEIAEIARTITLNPTFTTTTGAMQISMARQSGKVVWLSIAVNNSASVAAGGNVYVGDVAGIPFPPRVTSGGGYYGSNAIAGSIADNGHIVIRNASSSAVTISGSNNVTISFTYVVD